MPVGSCRPRGRHGVGRVGLAHDEGPGRGHWHRHERVREVYVVERPVYYAPPPRVYYPEPRYYGPPMPPSININIPLR